MAVVVVVLTIRLECEIFGVVAVVGVTVMFSSAVAEEVKVEFQPDVLEFQFEGLPVSTEAVVLEAGTGTTVRVFTTVTTLALVLWVVPDVFVLAPSVLVIVRVVPDPSPDWLEGATVTLD